MAKTKAPFQLVIRWDRFSPQRTLRWSFGEAIFNARAIEKNAAYMGEKITRWEIIRRSDKVVVAQSK